MMITEEFKEVIHTLVDLPTGAHLSGVSEGPLILVAAATQKQVKDIRTAFPGTTWRKEWNNVCKWWEYHSTPIGQAKIRIFGVVEKPATCEAITEKREITIREPTAWKDVTETVDVIVGWDCGNEEE